MRSDLKAFVGVLELAVARLYVGKVKLVPVLNHDPAGTLYTLSSAPEAFGELRRFADGAAHVDAVNQLLTAARAYLDARAKPVSHRIDHPELGLDKPKPL